MNGRPAYSEAFALSRLNEIPVMPARSAWDRAWAWGESQGEGVRVAVIDSGVDADHPAVGRGVQGYVSITAGPDGPALDIAPHRDFFGHGTACAGIIRSLAPACDLYSVRVLGPTLRGKGAIFAAGLRWAVHNRMDICNLSLGTTSGDHFSILHEIADEAHFSNVLFVAAANNMPTPSFPSVFASVFSVASHDVDDPECVFVNPNPPAEFGARGINVQVPWLDGGNLTATGNSFAAPHVAGLLARMRARHPWMTPPELRVLLRSVANNAREANDADR